MKVKHIKFTDTKQARDLHQYKNWCTSWNVKKNTIFSSFRLCDVKCLNVL